MLNLLVSSFDVRNLPSIRVSWLYSKLFSFEGFTKMFSFLHGLDPFDYWDYWEVLLSDLARGLGVLGMTWEALKYLTFSL